tara:strand:+ start:229 stop:411 length:183 start_codon:yes stop_codon:yes gene_type:complete
MTKLEELKLAYEEAYEERDKAEEERDKAEAVWDKADDECFKAYNAYRDEQYEQYRLNKED